MRAGVEDSGALPTSRTPGRYDIHTLGREVVGFITDVIGEPAILIHANWRVTGNGA